MERAHETSVHLNIFSSNSLDFRLLSGRGGSHDLHFEGDRVTWLSQI